MKVHEIDVENILYNKALELRYAVFFQKYDLSADIVNDQYENTSRHFVIAKGQTLMAYGRITTLGKGICQLSQIVVSPQERSKGYGEMMLQSLIEYCKNDGATKIILNARTTATKLYLRFGFICHGEIFLSKLTGVPHIEMQLTITST